jgi:transposase
MVVADGHGLPSGRHVDSAQPHESQLADATLATVRVPQRRGWPRTRPKELVADRAYDSRAWRQRRKPKRGRPIQTGASDRQRWKVERCFGWMDNCRRLVVRDERAVEHYHAFCRVAIILWCINLILK